MRLTEAKLAAANAHIPRIDTLRALAALSVIYIHYFQSLLPPSITIDGVQLFFTLSGFLITRTIILQEKQNSKGRTLAQFYIRRVCRIFPAYYIVVFASLALGIYGAKQCEIWALTFTVDFFMSGQVGDAGYLGHLWSIGVEEQFYLILPFLLLFLTRRMFITIVMASMLGAIAYRLVQFSISPTFPYNPVANIDKLGVGVLLALAVEAFGAPSVERCLRWVLPVAIPSFLLCCLEPILSLDLLFVFFGLPIMLSCMFFAWLIVKAVSDGPDANTWGGTILPKLGAISYGIYLYHLPMRAIADHFEQGSPSVVLRFLCVAATIGLAMLSFHAIEAPLMRFGKARLKGSAIPVAHPNVNPREKSVQSGLDRGSPTRP